MEKDMVRARKIIDAMIKHPNSAFHSKENGQEKFSFTDFYVHDPDELRSAFQERASDSPPYSSDFFQFNNQVANQHFAFTHSRLVWDRIGIPTQPTLINVLLDRTRHADNELQVGTYTLEDLEKYHQEDPLDEWFPRQIELLSKQNQPCVFVLYTDDEMGKKHDFPFGYMMELTIPEYEDGSGTSQLLMKCLQEGYNILDTYQLMKMNHQILASVIKKMAQSRHFQHKQIQYLTSFPIIVNLFSELLVNDTFEMGFKQEDTKRFTEVVFEAIDPIRFTLRSFTPSGVVEAHASVGVDFKFLDGLAEQCLESIGEGEHLVRFYNKSYMVQHNEPMWIPFLLLGGEVSPPTESSIH
jgi:hypothetical protein